MDPIALERVSKQIHWNVVDPHFHAVYPPNLDDVVAIAVDGTDGVAERMRAIHTIPNGRPGTGASATTVPISPEGEIFSSDGIACIVSAIEATVPTLCGVHDDV